MRAKPSEAGSALAEIAIVLPILVAVIIGGVDFARVFFATTEMTNAVRAAAQWGSVSEANAANSTVIGQIVAGAAPDISGISVSSAKVCQCATDAGVIDAPTDCATPCGSGKHQLINASVTATKTFNTIFRYPGILSSLSLSRTAKMRIK
jgi:Flp pilus assembly protein TadG